MSEVNLKDLIVSLETGKRPKGGAISAGIPSLGGEHINVDGGFNLNEDKLKYVALEYFNDMTKGKIKEKDILVVKDGATTGKVAYVDDSFPLEQACINEHVFLIRVNEAVLPKYLFYYFYSPVGQRSILKDFRGATVGGISTGFIDMNIYLPSKDIQERTVKILDIAKQAIDKRKEQIEACEELIKSKFIEMFGDPFLNPKGWDKEKLENICENLDSKRVPITSSDRESGIIPYYGASGIVDYVKDYIFDETLLLVSEDGANLLARVTPIAFEIKGKTWVNNHAHVLKFDNYSLQKYVEYVINLQDISSHITGSAQPKLNQAKLNKFLIPMPSQELLDSFAQFVEQTNNLKFEMEQSLIELENNFNSLMQRAFKGELF